MVSDPVRDAMFMLSDEDQELLSQHSDGLMLAIMQVNSLRKRLEQKASAIRKPMEVFYFGQPKEWQDSPDGIAVWHWLEGLDDEPCESVHEYVREYPDVPSYPTSAEGGSE